jgi:hypothetical protein
VGLVAFPSRNKLYPDLFFMANINPIDEAGIDGSKASFEDTINYKQTARESHRLLEDEEQCTNLQEGSHEEIIAAGESTKKESAGMKPFHDSVVIFMRYNKDYPHNRQRSRPALARLYSYDCCTQQF